MRQLRVIFILVLATVLGTACGDDEFNGLPDAPADDDTDRDGIRNAIDNCPEVANTDQQNTDGDATGDACDDDDDNDGVLDGADNCPIVANADQANADGDGDGDACDGDADGDTIADTADNCPTAANTNQTDTDGDGMGDACDPDDDNDTVLDAEDNCSLVANQDQVNSDDDVTGDACDDDDDNDTVLDADDNCALISNQDQVNSDEDPDGDACDTDDDDDTVLDGDDNCPTVANVDQNNTDADATGDACDDDDDNDGVADAQDNCALIANSDQTNSDQDTLGNACDDDDDGDGLPDVEDNCPGVGNVDQADTDFDGIGDACDGIFPTVSETLKGGNIIAVGKAWSAREDGVVKTDGDITLTGIPANATIAKAFLYWTTIGQPFPSVTFQGTSIQGAEIGQAQDTCWGIGNNFMYRADVTAMVTGDDTYTVRDILSSTSGPDGQGASLVVLYQDPDDTRDNFVKISDGAIGYVGDTASASVTATIGGFVLAANPDKVSVFNVVADGQDFTEQLTIQDTIFGASDPFSGNDGALWDTRVDDVTTQVQTGASEVVTTVSSQDDCLAWSMNAVVIENFQATPLSFATAPAKVARPVATRPAVPSSLRISNGRGGSR